MKTSKTIYKKYSKMEWLDNMILRNETSPGRNDMSDLYYRILKLIKDTQENGLITDQIYSTLNSWRHGGNHAYGYYNANIHYELFTCDEEGRDELEDRIIDFLKKTEPYYLEGWFKDDFLPTFVMFIRRLNNLNEPFSKDVILKYGNKKDIKILSMFERIMKKIENDRNQP